MRHGNLATVAAASVAPVDYPNISAFFRALKMPFITKQSYRTKRRHYVDPVISKVYEEQRCTAMEEAKRCSPDGLAVAMDGQFDSPGYQVKIAACLA